MADPNPDRIESDLSALREALENPWPPPSGDSYLQSRLEDSQNRLSQVLEGPSPLPPDQPPVSPEKIETHTPVREPAPGGVARDRLGLGGFLQRFLKYLWFRRPPDNPDK